jgi:hypothetical protein
MELAQEPSVNLGIQETDVKTSVPQGSMVLAAVRLVPVPEPRVIISVDHAAAHHVLQVILEPAVPRNAVPLVMETVVALCATVRMVTVAIILQGPVLMAVPQDIKHHLVAYYVALVNMELTVHWTVDVPAILTATM